MMPRRKDDRIRATVREAPKTTPSELMRAMRKLPRFRTDDQVDALLMQVDDNPSGNRPPARRTEEKVEKTYREIYINNAVLMSSRLAPSEIVKQALHEGEKVVGSWPHPVEDVMVFRLEREILVVREILETEDYGDIMYNRERRAARQEKVNSLTKEVIKDLAKPPRRKFAWRDKKKGGDE